MTRDERAMTHIGYEVEMCALSGYRMLTVTDQHAVNAYLECTLLHARGLEEFLVMTKGRPRTDDMLRTQFAPEWTPAPADAVYRLGARRSDINKHLAHLTWARVDRPESPAWPWIEITVDTVAIARAWVEHVTRSEDKDIDDPDIKALILLGAVENAERFLTQVPRNA